MKVLENTQPQKMILLRIIGLMLPCIMGLLTILTKLLITCASLPRMNNELEKLETTLQKLDLQQKSIQTFSDSVELISAMDVIAAYPIHAINLLSVEYRNDLQRITMEGNCRTLVHSLVKLEDQGIFLQSIRLGYPDRPDSQGLRLSITIPQHNNSATQ